MTQEQSTPKKAEIRNRRQQVSDLYLQGRTQMEIGDLLGVNQATVSRDLKALQKAWQEAALGNMKAKKAQELAKIDRLEREYYEAWQRSRQPKETESAKQVKSGIDDKVKPREEASLRKEQRDGDPRYLAGVQWCIDRRCKLLGLDAPELLKTLSTTVTLTADDLADARQKAKALEGDILGRTTERPADPDKPGD